MILIWCRYDRRWQVVKIRRFLLYVHLFFCKDKQIFILFEQFIFRPFFQTFSQSKKVRCQANIFANMFVKIAKTEGCFDWLLRIPQISRSGDQAPIYPCYTAFHTVNRSGTKGFNKVNKAFFKFGTHTKHQGRGVEWTPHLSQEQQMLQT